MASVGSSSINAEYSVYKIKNPTTGVERYYYLKEENGKHFLKELTSYFDGTAVSNDEGESTLIPNLKMAEPVVLHGGYYGGTKSIVNTKVAPSNEPSTYIQIYNAISDETWEDLSEGKINPSILIEHFPTDGIYATNGVDNFTAVAEYVGIVDEASGGDVMEQIR